MIGTIDNVTIITISTNSSDSMINPIMSTKVQNHNSPYFLHTS